MSRWFPDHVELRFGDAPSAVSAHGSPAARAGQVVAGKLDAALIAFERELDALDLPRGTRLTCVLAGEGVRYRVVPWRDDLASPAQRQLLATQCFAEAYGDAARSWTVRQNAGGHGAATLACAVDSTLLDRIDAMTQARGLRLVSVQPSLMHAFNRVRGRIGAALFWFVCIEGPWTTLLLTTGDEPLHVKVLPTASGDLSRLLDREWFALGVETARCPVVVSRLVDEAEASSGLAPTLVKGWQVINLDAGVERHVAAVPAAVAAPAAAQASSFVAPLSTQPVKVAIPTAAPPVLAAPAPVVPPAVAPVVHSAPTIRPSAAAPTTGPAVVPAPASALIPALSTTPAELPLAATPASSYEAAARGEPVATAMADRSSHPVETTIVNATPKPIASSSASLPAPMSASIQATMPAPFIAKPFVPMAAEPRPQPAPLARPAVVEPVPVAEPESVSIVAIPQFEWWSAPPAAAPSSPPAMPAKAAVAAALFAPTNTAAPTAPVAAAVAPAPVATAPAARSAQLPPQPLPTVLPAAAPAATAHAARAAAVPALPATRSASAPRPAPVARQASAELATHSATDAEADPVESFDDDDPAPRKWTSFFRRRPKAPAVSKVAAPPDDDMPVPRWVNGRWESS